MIAAAMEQREVSIRDLAEHMEATYEHARRMARGESIPSKFLLKELCKFLGIDFHAAEKASTADKIQEKYGTIPQEIAGKTAGLDPIERVWPQLTEEQQQSVIVMVQGWVKMNRARNQSL